MIMFKRNPKTGELEAYKNGKLVGIVTTMGDKVKKVSKKKPKDKTT